MTLLLHRDIDVIVHNNLTDETNVKDSNKKMYKDYLVMHNIRITNSLEETRKATEEHKCKKQDLKYQLIEIKIKPLITYMH